MLGTFENKSYYLESIRVYYKVQHRTSLLYSVACWHVSEKISSREPLH